jgi:hypothetical protein
MDCSGVAFCDRHVLIGCNEYDIYDTVAMPDDDGYNSAYVKWRIPTVS